MHDLDDLIALNKRILTQLQARNVNLHRILPLLPVCLGRLVPSAEELGAVLGRLSSLEERNPLDVVAINKDYLALARQTARDVTYGRFEGLVMLNINLAQARVLASLSNQQIAELARRWPGTIFEMAGAARECVAPLHSSAAPHYSAAMVAAA